MTCRLFHPYRNKEMVQRCQAQPVCNRCASNEKPPRPALQRVAMDTFASSVSVGVVLAVAPLCRCMKEAIPLFTATCVLNNPSTTDHTVQKGVACPARIL